MGASHALSIGSQAITNGPLREGSSSTISYIVVEEGKLMQFSGCEIGPPLADIDDRFGLRNLTVFIDLLYILPEHRPTDGLVLFMRIFVQVDLTAGERSIDFRSLSETTIPSTAIPSASLYQFGARVQH